MNFRDRWVEDENGERFVFTVEMQRKLSQAGLPVEPASIPLLGAIPKVESRPAPQPQPPPRKEPEPEITGPATIQIDPETGKYIGRIKWYNAKKGYGFIVRGAGEEIFFHKSATLGETEEFEEGQWILYDVEETNKGPEASDVEPYLGVTPE